jgi:glycosyltransferase involved in cell wall biosynthesis
MTREVRVLVLADFLFPEYLGGSARFATALNESLVDSGCDVDCITRAPAGLYGSDLESDHRARVLYSTRGSLAGIAKTICIKKHHIIISHHYLLGLLALLVPRKTKRIYFFHGPVAAESKAKGSSFLVQRIKQFLESLVLANSNEIYCLSEYMAGKVPTLFQGKTRVTGPLHSIPVPNQLQQKKTNHVQQLKFLTVRRLTPRTGVLELAKLISRLEGVQLTIIGKGELYAEIKKIDSANIQLIQGVTDELLEQTYRASDLVILPSKELEGFGLVIVESLLRGTPVLASNKAGGGADFLCRISKEFIYDLQSSPKQFMQSAIVAIKTYNDARIREDLLHQLGSYSIRHFSENIISSISNGSMNKSDNC